MGLLIIIFLMNADSIDSLKITTSAQSSSGGTVLEYSYGLDTYQVGFNKNSISANIPEESIDVSSGLLSIKIKLTSLPIRGNKSYDVYLVYHGSPLSLAGIGGFSGTWTYGWNNSEFIGNDEFIVTEDLGTCGLGWNIMPGEFSVPYRWWEKRGVVGEIRINDRTYSFYMGDCGGVLAEDCEAILPSDPCAERNWAIF
ncbi:MAG: hypothetical protein ABIN61_00435 [candidate division WOR-3 bacterium]